MLSWEVNIAREAAQKQDGKPRLLPVRLNYDGPLPDELANVLKHIDILDGKVYKMINV